MWASPTSPPRDARLTTSVAFVTPSYRLDLERCRLLNRSLDTCTASFEHWIVVDRGDLPLFRPLQNNRTNVVAKEEILPLWVRRLDTVKLGLRSNVWLQSRGLPIRGWLLQQFVKLAVANHLGADVLVHADSDVVFLRPFSADSIVDAEQRVRLYARPDYVTEALPGHLRWHRSAERLLDLAPAEVPLPDYISSLVPWRRTSAVALLEHIERTTGRHWLRALAAEWNVSEYTLYGRFAEDVLGADGRQYVSPAPLCLDYYKRMPLTVPELSAFLDRLGPEAIAVSLTAKAGMSPGEYVDALERHWAEPVPAKPPVEARPAAHARTPGAPSATRSGRTRRPVRGGIPRRRSTVSRLDTAAGRRQLERATRLAARSGMVVVLAFLFLLMLVLLGLGFD